MNLRFTDRRAGTHIGLMFLNSLNATSAPGICPMRLRVSVLRTPQAVFHFVFPLHGNPKAPSPAPAAPSVAPALLGKAALWLRARFLFFSFSLKSLKKF